MCGGDFMPENEQTLSSKIEGENPVITLERNGRSFPIIEHFSEEKTFTDIVKNALRREFEAD
jgi:hypothetical protein